MRRPRPNRFAAHHLLPLAAGLLLAQCVVLALATLRWPLTGDAVLMHYVVFLMQHGFAPYRDIVDMNFPGTYAADWAVMRTLGTGALAWRIWDFTLLAIVVFAMAVIAGPRKRSAALTAAPLFALLHWQDGILHEGQRDLLMTALLLLATAALTCVLRNPRRGSCLIGAAGVLFGAASIVKPLAFLPALLLLVLFFGFLRAYRRTIVWPVFASILGFSLPVLATLAFLLHWHSVQAFKWTLTALLPLDAALGRRPLLYFFEHGLSPVQPLGYLLLILTFLIYARSASILRTRSITQNWLGAILLVGISGGLFSYIAQGKGYPYHRYPLLAFVLLAWGLVSRQALRAPHSPRCLLPSLGCLGLVYATLFAGPHALIQATSFEPQDPTQSLLEADLVRLGGVQLSGNLQCLDMSAGCIRALWQLRLVQSTGVLYDYTLLTPGNHASVTKVRKRFINQITLHPPQVFVVTEQDYLFGAPHYRKLERWPVLNSFINEHYRLWAQRTPTTLLHDEPRAVVPSGYRIYLLRSDSRMTPVK